MKALVLFVAVTCASMEAQNCSREALRSIAANYFKAVETHQPSALATTGNVRITENAAEIKPGEGFFKAAARHSSSAPLSTRASAAH
jgi:hypothetical protein